MTEIILTTDKFEGEDNPFDHELTKYRKIGYGNEHVLQKYIEFSNLRPDLLNRTHKTLSRILERSPDLKEGIIHFNITPNYKDNPLKYGHYDHNQSKPGYHYFEIDLDTLFSGLFLEDNLVEETEEKLEHELRHGSDHEFMVYRARIGKRFMNIHGKSPDIISSNDFWGHFLVECRSEGFASFTWDVYKSLIIDNFPACYEGIQEFSSYIQTNQRIVDDKRDVSSKRPHISSTDYSQPNHDISPYDQGKALLDVIHMGMLIENLKAFREKYKDIQGGPHFAKSSDFISAEDHRNISEKVRELSLTDFYNLFFENCQVISQWSNGYNSFSDPDNVIFPKEFVQRLCSYIEDTHGIFDIE